MSTFTPTGAISYGPPLVVDAPRPVAPRFGLVASARIVDDNDLHWANGVAMRGNPFRVDGQAWFTCDPSAEQPADPPFPNPPFPEGKDVTPLSGGESDFAAFTIYLRGYCTTRGIVNVEDMRARIADYFTAMESRYVEQVLEVQADSWGQIALSSATVDVPVGTAVPPAVALSILEQELSTNYGQRGMIHASRAVVSRWSDGMKLHVEGNQLVTQLGNVVVAGDGYAGADPKQEVAHSAVPPYTSAWAYVTPMIELRRSDLFIVPGDVREAIRTAENTVAFNVERVYAYVGDLDNDTNNGYRGAVLVDLT